VLWEVGYDGVRWDAGYNDAHDDGSNDVQDGADD
jgi:hypothetical protein